MALICDNCNGTIPDIGKHKCPVASTNALGLHRLEELTEEPPHLSQADPKATPNDRAELRSQLWRIKKLAELEDYELMAEIEATLAHHTQQKVLEARIEELENLQKLHARTYRQTVTDSNGDIYVDESHGYISKYETQERLAELTALQETNGTVPGKE